MLVLNLEESDVRKLLNILIADSRNTHPNDYLDYELRDILQIVGNALPMNNNNNYTHYNHNNWNNNWNNNGNNNWNNNGNNNGNNNAPNAPGFPVGNAIPRRRRATNKKRTRRS